jgi:hypothetical protein
MRDGLRDAMGYAPAHDPVETCKSRDTTHLPKIPVPRQELSFLIHSGWICVEYTTRSESFVNILELMAAAVRGPVNSR